jgi:hypothetical protein
VPRGTAAAIARKIDAYVRRVFRQQASFVELLPTLATAF